MNENPGSMRVGTRGSPLAMAQARMTADALQVAHGPDLAVSLVEISTKGDRVQDRALREIGGKALWTRELDRALLDGDIDCAVHSMKDVETFLARGIALVAVLERADPRDRLIGAESLSDLLPGTVVGTSSPRRAAQLLHRRPDLNIVTLRGNVQTRLNAIAEGRVGASFLAAAGLDRLGIAEGHVLAIDDWLPAASQGIVGITCRADDARTQALLKAINHPPSMVAMEAERAVLEGLGGSCHTSVAVHAYLVAGGIDLHAELLSPDGRDRVADSIRGDGAPRALGLALAARLMAAATPDILASLDGAAAA